MTKQTTDQSLRDEIEALFLERIYLIDQINHFGLGREDDERDAFILLGTPAQLIEALGQLFIHHTTTAVREARIDLLEEILSADDSGDFISQMAHAVGAVGRMYQDLQSHPTSTKDAA